jgi:hypothetical protein
MNQHKMIIVGADTDGLAFKKPDGKPFTPEERKELLEGLNSKMDHLIRWEDDGVFRRQIVIKTKNYILQDEKGNVKIKGSGLKATSKEKALRRFIKEVIDMLLKDRKDQIYNLYLQYAKQIVQLNDISDWCVKKTVTKSVLNPERTNEQRVLDALEDSDSNEGDKVYMFFRTPEELCLRENFDGTYDVDILLKKLYKTLEVFETVIDIDLFPNFSLVRNRPLLGIDPKKKTGSFKLIQNDTLPNFQIR